MPCLDLILLGDAANGEQRLTVMVARLVRPGTAPIPSAAIRPTPNGLIPA